MATKAELSVADLLASASGARSPKGKKIKSTSDKSKRLKTPKTPKSARKKRTKRNTVAPMQMPLSQSDNVVDSLNNSDSTKNNTATRRRSENVRDAFTTNKSTHSSRGTGSRIISTPQKKKQFKRSLSFNSNNNTSKGGIIPPLLISQSNQGGKKPNTLRKGTGVINEYSKWNSYKQKEEQFASKRNYENPFQYLLPNSVADELYIMPAKENEKDKFSGKALQTDRVSWSGLDSTEVKINFLTLQSYSIRIINPALYEQWRDGMQQQVEERKNSLKQKSEETLTVPGSNGEAGAPMHMLSPRSYGKNFPGRSPRASRTPRSTSSTSNKQKKENASNTKSTLFQTYSSYDVDRQYNDFKVHINPLFLLSTERRGKSNKNALDLQQLKVPDFNAQETGIYRISQEKDLKVKLNPLMLLDKKKSRSSIVHGNLRLSIVHGNDQQEQSSRKRSSSSLAKLISDFGEVKQNNGATIVTSTNDNSNSKEEQE